eukprot:5364512-Pyramimonas_sp.AAC.1
MAGIVGIQFQLPAISAARMRSVLSCKRCYFSWHRRPQALIFAVYVLFAWCYTTTLSKGVHAQRGTAPDAPPASEDTLGWNTNCSYASGASC